MLANVCLPLFHEQGGRRDAPPHPAISHGRRRPATSTRSGFCVSVVAAGGRTAVMPKNFRAGGFSTSMPCCWVRSTRRGLTLRDAAFSKARDDPDHEAEERPGYYRDMLAMRSACGRGIPRRDGCARRHLLRLPLPGKERSASGWTTTTSIRRVRAVPVRQRRTRHPLLKWQKRLRGRQWTGSGLSTFPQRLYALGVLAGFSKAPYSCVGDPDQTNSTLARA